MKKISVTTLIAMAFIYSTQVSAAVGTCNSSYMYVYPDMLAYPMYFNFSATATKADGTVSSFYKNWTPPGYSAQPYGEITLVNPTASVVTLYITAGEDNMPVTGDQMAHW
jgi:hypothetical protein